jgi:hypothetical protein
MNLKIIEMARKILKHRFRNADICIYKHTDNEIVDSFFKEKPEIGDLIMSHNKRERGNVLLYEIVSNRDSLISADSNYNPALAYFELEVKNVTNDDRFSEVDKSMQSLY